MTQVLAGGPEAVSVHVDRMPKTVYLSVERWHLGITVVGLILALIGSAQVTTSSLNDLGLVSGISPLTAISAFVVVVSATFAIFRTPFNERWTAAHVIAVVVMLSGAPAIAYDTARFSWAFKHIGIVEYITRTGGVDPDIEVLAVYHNWPGFFASAASLTELAGVENALDLARWAPLAFNLLTLVGLTYLLRQLSLSRQVVWLAVLLFFVTNWVGQDYFAPQAVGYVLYLFLLGLVLRHYRRHSSVKPTLLTHGALILGAAALVMTHQLTPIALTGVLLGLVAIRQLSIVFPAALAALFGLWAVSGAWPFVRANAIAEVQGVGSPVGNAAQGLSRAIERSDDQTLVALAGRGILLTLGLLAVVGLVQLLRGPRYDLAPFVILLAPFGLLLLEFGGENLFRVALFMLPILALAAATAFMSIDNDRARLAFSVTFVGALFVAFSVSYYGKDRFYSFTADEVALVEHVMAIAPPNSLLVEGSRNYPTQFLEYEKFTYVPIEREPAATVDRLAANPADQLFEWLDDDRYAASYLLLTRSQQAEAEALGSLPADFLIDVEAALRGDERFSVLLENPDGVVFVPTPESRG